MPYIEQSEREYIKQQLAKAKSFEEFLSSIDGTGCLNFILTKICLAYLSRPGCQIRYESLNAVIGALECAKAEIQRRLLGPYEDEKIKLHGDVY